MVEHGFRKFIITLTVIAATIIELIDTSIVNVALTDMSGNLGATLEDTAWVVTGYAIANVIIIPMTSFLAARFGRRRYYIGSILLFTASSVMCGQAHGIWELVAFRVIQGIGGGALLSTSQAILFEIFSVADRGIAAAIFGLGVFIGPTIGPTVGGWIIDNHSWPWIFYINLPIGLAAAALSYLYVREPGTKRHTESIDWTGIGLLVAGLGSLQVVLERGQHEDWFAARYITVLTAVAAVSLVVFVFWEMRVEHPVVDLRVLRSRTLAVCAVLTFVLGFVLFASVFLVPVFVQQLLGFTAMETGMLFLPGAAVAVFTMPVIGRLLSRGTPPQFLVIPGFIGVAVFSYSLSLQNLGSGEADFFWPIILRAVSLGVLAIPLTQLAVSGLRPREIPQGVALNNMMRQVGGAFGIALMNTYVTHRMAAHRSDLVSHLTAGSPVTQERLHRITGALLAQGATPVAAQHRALALLDHLVNRQSSLLAYVDTFRFIALFSIVCIPLILFAGRPKSLSAAAAAAGADAH